jgi:hypothetical protein
MRSYRSLFRAPEFTPFLLSFAAFAAAQTIGGLALATLVFRALGRHEERSAVLAATD